MENDLKFFFASITINKLLLSNINNKFINY